MSTLLLLTQFNRSQKCLRHRSTIFFPLDTPSILDGRGVLQLLIVLISRQKASGLSSVNFLASASLRSAFSLFLINRKAYLNLESTAYVGVWIPCKHLSLSIQYLLMSLSVMLFHLIFALPLLILLVKFGILSLFMYTLNGIWSSSLTSYIILILLILLWKSLLAITWSSQEVVFHLSLTYVYDVSGKWNEHKMKC